jgi:hypothetical protein
MTVRIGNLVPMYDLGCNGVGCLRSVYGGIASLACCAGGALGATTFDPP